MSIMNVFVLYFNLAKLKYVTKTISKFFKNSKSINYILVFINKCSKDFKLLEPFQIYERIIYKISLFIYN